MPVATTSGTKTERFDLKTLPEGFVVIRRMTYGEYLERREMLSMMHLRSGSDGDKSFAGSMQLVSAKAVELDFARCIMDHNLEDEEGKRLDLTQAKNIRSLDPRIGDEIGTYIDKMNQFTAEDQGN